MKKTMTRIAACSLAVLLAFNAVLVPRSKAVGAEVVGTAALATSTLAAYMTATGVPLTVTAGGAAAASAGAASLISGYAAATGGTYSVVTTALASGVTIGTGGAIIIGAAAAALLAGIVAWAVKEYGLKDSLDSAPVPVYSSAPNGFYINNGSTFCEFSQIVYTTGEPYVIPGHAFTGYSDITVSSDSESTKTIEMYGGSYRGFETFVWKDNPSNTIKYQCGGHMGQYIICDTEKHQWIFTKLSEDDAGYWRLNGTFIERYSFADYPWLFEFFNVTSSGVSAETVPDYAPLPDLAESEQVELAVNLPAGIQPEDVPDAIFEKIADNEFESVYEISQVPDSGSTPNPDTGSDSDSGLDSNDSIGWLRRIALACESLADKIIDGVRDIFVPDAALTTQITDAFAAKFSFVPTLHRLGTDLLSIGPDSKPPVVYIHLEDAEGTIDYGGTVKALDMSWYERYKEDGDRIIGGFLWLGFLWLLFKRVPAIINGGEMVQEYTADIDRGSKRRKQ